MISERLKGKKIFITGGSRGIGRAIAIACAKEGADVVISYCNSKNEATETVSIISQFGNYSNKLRVDLCKANETKKLIERVLNKFDHIDVLINNAGILTRNIFMEVTDAEFRRVFEINLFAPFILTRDVAKDMIKKNIKGSIINIGSISSEKGSNYLPHYGSSKAGLVTLTKSASLALGRYGIRVNCIQPGLTETDLNEDLRINDKNNWEKKTSSIPLGRVGTPQDHVGAVLFLASNESAWVTGTSIIIDGGRSIHF